MSRKPSINYEVSNPEDVILLKPTQRQILQMRLGLPPYNKIYSRGAISRELDMAETAILRIESLALQELGKLKK